MPWYPTTPQPPAPKQITGWWAVMKVLAQQQVSVINFAETIGIIAALQTLPLTNSAKVRLEYAPNQIVSLANSGVAKGLQAANQSFALNNQAFFANSVIASNQLNIFQLATVVGAMTALQPIPLTNKATPAGYQAAWQPIPLTNKGFGAGVRNGVSVFEIIDGATVLGAPKTENQIQISDYADVIGIVLSEQQIQMLNAATITGFEGTLGAFQPIPLINSATLRGLQQAGQSFTVLDSAKLAGKSGAANAFALTSNGAAKAVSLAGVQFVLSNKGTVYAKVNAAQSFSLGNSATAVQETSGPGFSQVTVFTASTAGPYTFQNTAVQDSTVLLALQGNSTAPFQNVTYGGLPMEFVDGVNIAAIGRVELWKLVKAPGGQKTVGFARVGANFNAAAALSYTGIEQVFLGYNATSNGIASSTPVFREGDIALQVFASANATNTTTGGTNRVNQSVPNSTGTLVVSDSLVNGTTFALGTTGYYGALSIVLRGTKTLNYVSHDMIADMPLSGKTYAIPHYCGDRIIAISATDRGAALVQPTFDGVPMDVLANEIHPGYQAGAHASMHEVIGKGGTKNLVFAPGTAGSWAAVGYIAYDGVYDIHEIQLKANLKTEKPTQTVPSPPSGGKWLHSFGGIPSSGVRPVSGAEVVRAQPTATYIIATIEEASAATTFEGVQNTGIGGYVGIAAALVNEKKNPLIYYAGRGSGIITVDSKTASGSWQVPTRAGDYIIVDVMGDDAGTAMSYNGVALTLLGSYQSGTGSANQQLASFQRFGGFVTAANAGWKNVSWTGSTPSGGCHLQAYVYRKVVSVGATTHAFGSGGTPSISRTCSPGELIVCGFGANSSNVAWVPTGGTVRYVHPTQLSMPLALIDSRESATFQLTGATVGNWNAFTTLLKVAA